MRVLFLASALAVTQLAVSSVCAQTATSDQAAVRAERKAEGVEAARTFTPGEGNPKPEPKAKVSKETRASARQTRKVAGAEAAREFMPGEGDPKPEATPKVSREERTAAGKARRAEIKRANKAGELPSFGDNYPDSYR